MSKRTRTFNHGDKETRRRKAIERLGDTSPKCIYGDETNPHALQLHHVSGEKHGDELVPVCLNHHAQLSDAQKDHPFGIGGCASPFEGVGHFLLGLGDMLLLAAEQHAGSPLEELLRYVSENLKKVGLSFIELARTTCSPPEEGPV